MAGPSPHSYPPSHPQSLTSYTERFFFRGEWHLEDDMDVMYNYSTLLGIYDGKIPDVYTM
jgi:hypothetical protein